MLTALPYRFHFEAIGLAGFQVPRKAGQSKRRYGYSFYQDCLSLLLQFMMTGCSRSDLCLVKLSRFRANLAVHLVQGW
jgi:hypothetical protein